MISTHTQASNRDSRRRGCQCQHYQSVICESKKQQTSLLNIQLRGDRCYCLCHLNDDAQQVSEQVWQRRRMEVEA